MPHISRDRKPEHLSLEDWQVALRREYARQQQFESENIGSDPVFSEFRVTNPASGNTYRVAVRGTGLGENFCSCPDFSSNHLGTCKHIEWTLHWLEKQPDSAAKLREGFTPPYSEVYLVYGAQRRVRFHPGSECPVELIEQAAADFDDAGYLKADRFEDVEAFLRNARESTHDLRVYDDVLRFLAEKRDERLRTTHIEEAFPGGADSPAFEHLLQRTLFRFQQENALFAARAGRAILGDQPGLGKTTQAIAAAEIMAKCHGVESVLVLCPQSLRQMWQDELDACTDAARYRIFAYEDLDAKTQEVADIAPQLVILDEAHRVADWKGPLAATIRKLTAEYCLVLTGNPIDARIEEMIAIVQFVDAHRLGPTYRLLHEHQRRDATGRVTGYRNLDRLAETLAPILRHTTRTQVAAELPQLAEKWYYLPMNAAQRALHEDSRSQLERLSSRARQTGSLSNAEQRRVHDALREARMACDSSFLVDHRVDQSPKLEEIDHIVSDLLCENGSKTVICSEWLPMLRLLQGRLTKSGRPSLLIHNGQSRADRDRVARQFNSDRDARICLVADGGCGAGQLHRATAIVQLDVPLDAGIIEVRQSIVEQPAHRLVSLVSANSVEAAIDRAHREGKSIPPSLVTPRTFLPGDDLSEFTNGLQLLAPGDRGEASSSAPPAGKDINAWMAEGLETLRAFLAGEAVGLQLPPAELRDSLLESLAEIQRWYADRSGDQ